MVSEFIGMTAALGIFGIPHWITTVIVIILMAIMVLQGRTGPGEDRPDLLCHQPDLYPGCFPCSPGLVTGPSPGLFSTFSRWVDRPMFFFLMANVEPPLASVDGVLFSERGGDKKRQGKGYSLEPA